VFSRNTGIYKNNGTSVWNFFLNSGLRKFRGLTENDAHADQITKKKLQDMKLQDKRIELQFFVVYFLNMQRYDALCVNQCLCQIGNMM